jgi:hypothetical protein
MLEDVGGTAAGIIVPPVSLIQVVVHLELRIILRIWP